MVGEKIYQAMNLEYQSDIRRGPSISSMGYCELQTMNLFMREEKKDIPPANLLAMRTGTATHEALFKLLYKWRGEIEGFTYHFKEREVTLDTPAGNIIKGHLDLYAEINGEELVIDLKVIDEGAYNMIVAEPRKHEVDQVMLYCAALKCEKGMLVYLCKGGRRNRGNFKEFKFEVDKLRVQELLAKYDRIMAGNARRPFADPQESWECTIGNGCPYYEECWGARAHVSRFEGVEVIPPELEEKYRQAVESLDSYKEVVSTIKAEIEDMLQGRRGEGSELSAYYIKPTSFDSYHSSLLKKYIDPGILAKCAKKVERDGYYMLKFKKKEEKAPRQE